MLKRKTPPKRRRLDDPEQSRLFVKKAREIGADEEDSAADALLGALHKKPHEPRTEGPQRKRRTIRDKLNQDDADTRKDQQRETPS